MDRDTVLRLAQQAGLLWMPKPTRIEPMVATPDRVLRFAELIEAHVLGLDPELDAVQPDDDIFA